MSSSSLSTSTLILACVLSVLCSTSLILILLREGGRIYSGIYPTNAISLKNAPSYTRNKRYREWEADAKSKINITNTTSTNQYTLDGLPTINTNAKGKVLCATFLRPSLTSLKQLLENMEELHNNCDWAVLAIPHTTTDKSTSHTTTTTTTTESLSLFNKYHKKALEIKNINIQLFQYAKSRSEIFLSIDPTSANKYMNDNTLYNNFSYPKPSLFLELVPLLPQYEYVWLIDDDIDLSHFRYDN